MIVMLARIKRLLAPPVFADEEKTRVAALLNIMALGGFVLVGIRGLVSFVLRSDPAPVALAGLLMGLMVGMLILIRYGYVRLAGLILPLAGFGVATITMFYLGGIRLPISNFYLFAIVAAGLLLGGRAVIGFAVACIVAGSGLVLAETFGLLLSPAALVPLGFAWVAQSLQCAVVAIDVSGQPQHR